MSSQVWAKRPSVPCVQRAIVRKPRASKRNWSAFASRLENKFQSELQDARQMRASRAQVAAAGASGVSGGVIGPTVARDRIRIRAATGVVGAGSRITPQPRVFHVIENVKG